MLTPRENLLKVFNHEPPEWIPVVGRIDPYSQPGREGMAPELAQALGTVKWGDGGSRIFSQALGLDIMDYFNTPLAIKRSKVTVKRINQDKGWVNLYQTPFGELREVYKIIREDGTAYCVEHLVKSGDDLPALTSIFADEEISLKEEAVDFFRQRQALVGDQGLVYSGMPGTPLGMMVRVYSGVETLAYLWSDYRAELRQLFRVMEENYLRQFRLMASLGYDLLFGMDDTSTTCVSPAMFEEFCLGYTDHVADAVHEFGCRYVHHSCGLITHLLDLYRQTRMDAVDALTLKPVGDIERLYQAREKVGRKITIITHAGFNAMGRISENQEKLAARVAEMFQDAAPGDNIIFRIAPNPHINMAELAFIAQEHRKYQRMYPAVYRSSD